MDFNHLLHIVGEEPVFETSLLLAGAVDPRQVQRQLSRWVRSGRLYRLRRGLYALAPPYQKVKPHPFLVANRLVRPSYVSLQSALATYGLIPEYVPHVTSVTPRRPGLKQTPLGQYEFRHLQPSLFFGYRQEDVGEGQQAFIATPEKALLDLLYLHPGGDEMAYLRELRLQNLEQLSEAELQRLAAQFGRPKMTRAVARIVALKHAEAEAYESL